MITLATLPRATEQEVFDHVAKHLLSQKRKSSIDKMCAYRARKGTLKCAAGCLISDEEYEKLKSCFIYKYGRDRGGIENLTWGKLVDEELVPKEHENLIDILQRIHDRIHAKKWRRALKELATERNLIFNF